jgi:hypothetical protein
MDDKRIAEYRARIKKARSARHLLPDPGPEAMLEFLDGSDEALDEIARLKGEVKVLERALELACFVDGGGRIFMNGYIEQARKELEPK